MTYRYSCENEQCQRIFEVIKSVKDFEREEKCSCGYKAKREYVKPRIYLAGTQVQEKKWQPALGRPATDNELKGVAKRHDWTEVGNEDVSKHVEPPRVEYPTFSNDDIQSLCRKMDLEGSNPANDK